MVCGDVISSKNPGPRYNYGALLYTYRKKKREIEEKSRPGCRSETARVLAVI